MSNEAPSLQELSGADALAALAWLVESGADEAIGDEAIDRTKVQAVASAVLSQPVTAATLQPAASAPAPVAGTSALAEDARKAAQAAQSLDELRTALENFEGASLKHTATNLVFADGNPEARVMLIGEAPGREEDRLGKPFVGESGRLLDRMLAAIGLSREESVYITNIINWRPPGNRNPTDSEVAIFMPFLRRHIELARPDFLLLAGGVSAKAVLEASAGITRLRGQWHDFKSEGLEKTIRALPVFHPAYLLRTPIQKRSAWKDLLMLRHELDAAD